MTGTIERKAQAVIDAIRPAIQADGGDVFFRAFDPVTGVVAVELTGACVTCPVSTVTLNDGIERIMVERIPGVTAVRHVGETLADAGEDGTPVTIGGGKISPFAR